MSAQVDEDEITGRIATLLIANGATVAVAETSAGGMISGALLGVPGASAWFGGGVIPYTAKVREAWLGLGADAFGHDGAVSATAAVRLAEAVRAISGTTWGLAETGIAGPQSGRRSSKPAGLAFVAVAGPTSTPIVIEVRTGLDGRRENQEAFTSASLRAFLKVLESVPGQ